MTLHEAELPTDLNNIKKKFMGKIKTETKTAILTGLFSIIISVILFASTAIKEKNIIMEEAKRKGRLLTAQIILTLNAESRQDSTYTIPSILSQNTSKAAFSKGLYTFKFIDLSNKQNKINDLEQEAFLHFEEGDDEFNKLVGNQYQYIAPIYADASCIKCHPNYEAGQLSGEVIASFPIQDLNVWIKNTIVKTSIFVLINFSLFYIIVKFLLKLFLPIQKENIADSIIPAEKVLSPSPAQQNEEYLNKIKEKDSEIIALNQKIDEHGKEIKKIKENYNDKERENNNLKQEISKLKIEHDGNLQKLKDLRGENFYQKKINLLALLNIQEGICIVNKEKKINLWSMPLEKIIGYSQEEMIGKNLNEGIFLIKDKNVNSIEEENSPLNIALQKGESISLSAKLKRRNNEILDINIKTISIKDSSEKIFGGIIIISIKPREIHTDTAKLIKTEIVKDIENSEQKNLIRLISDYIEIMRDGDTGDLNKTQMEFMDELHDILKQLKL